MHSLFTLNPKVSTALFTFIGFILIDDFNTLEQNVIGNWLMLTAQVIITNASSQQLIEQYAAGSTLNINSQKVKNTYSPVNYDIDTLRSIISQIHPEEMQILIEDLHERLSKIEEILYEIYDND